MLTPMRPDLCSYQNYFITQLVQILAGANTAPALAGPVPCSFIRLIRLINQVGSCTWISQRGIVTVFPETRACVVQVVT